jgi:hypothetical protein
VLNAILKTFADSWIHTDFSHSGFSGEGGGGGVLFVFFLCTQYCQFFFIVPSVFSNVYSTIVNGVAEERYFRVSTLSVPGEGYSRNA